MVVLEVSLSIFRCRWPNGDFSIVQANSKEEAIKGLDEFGHAEQAIVKRMTAYKFDFGLDDRGAVVLKGTGEETEEIVARECYPELKTVFAAVDRETRKGKRKVREAVEWERTRLADSAPKRKPAKTELGRRLQERTGMPSALVNEHVDRAAKE